METINRYTILGCGSSAGVPRIGGDWGACDPANPKNRRRRCAMLVERISDAGITRVLIDTGPDMREQLIDAGVGTLDAVVFTHPHADHIHGIDDLRVVVYNRKSRLDVYADATTANALIARFGYVFVQPEGSSYPPVLDLHTIDKTIVVDGPGGPLTLQAFEVEHGRINAQGFRIGGLAYLPDVSAMTNAAWDAVQGLDIWVLDALRYEPHPTHANLETALKWISRAAPKQAVLTNMHIDLDYETVLAQTPQNVSPAYDGMVLDLPV